MTDSREVEVGAPSIERAWQWHRFQSRWIPGRFATRLARRALRAWGAPVVVRLPAGFRMRLDLRDDIQCTIARNGEWEGEIFDACAALVRPGDTVLDVGAHVGYASLRFAQWVGAGGRVIAFEPLPAHLAAVRENLELNGWLDRASLVAAAASDRSGEAHFAVRDGLNLGVGALAAGPASRTAASVAGTGTHNAPIAGSVADTVVATVAMDDWLDAEPDRRRVAHIALCKIDIEGAEGLALRGLSRSLAAHRIDALLVELHPATLPDFGDTVDGIVRLCASQGYRIRWWNNAGAFVAPPAPAGATYMLALAPGVSADRDPVVQPAAKAVAEPGA